MAVSIVSGYSKDRMRENPRGQIELPIHCVFLTCFENDFRFIASILCYAGIVFHRAETIDQADFLLTVTEGSVLLSDVVFLDGTCLDALEMQAQVHPMVSTIVMADSVDLSFAGESIHRGAWQVIERPLPMASLRRTIEAAGRACAERTLEVGIHAAF